MPSLLTLNVWKELTDAAAASIKPAHVAVAYFGHAGPKLLPLPKGSSLVVDASIATVSQGATSPAALEELRKKGVDVYSAQYLHAKVFAFDKVGFVGSANASDHSASKLIEALVKVQTPQELSEIRDFVSSICLTKLSSSELKDLRSFYKKPSGLPKPGPKQGMFSTLLMELTLEQGLNRITQVQPPKGVWRNFFQLPWPMVGNLPTLTLVNEKVVPNQQAKRNVVKHDHTYTIEIADAVMPRPAILQMKRLGKDKFGYVVHRPQDKTFATVRHLVDTLPNPHLESGRRWVLL